MAFPVVAHINSGFHTGTTSHVLGLPPNISAGDLLIVMVTFDGVPTVTWPAGWNQAANDLFALSNGTAIRAEGKKRTADGTEGGSITVTTSVSEGRSHIALRITGQHSSTVPAVATATGVSTNPNPASLNPADWDIEDTLWIAYAGHDAGGADDDDITAYPTNYTGTVIVQSNLDAGGSGCAAAWRNNAVASEDPGTFTTPTSEDWICATIAVRPGAGVARKAGRLSLLGVGHGAPR